MQGRDTIVRTANPNNVASARPDDGDHYYDYPDAPPNNVRPDPPISSIPIRGQIKPAVASRKKKKVTLKPQNLMSYNREGKYSEG